MIGNPHPPQPRRLRRRSDSDEHRVRVENARRVGETIGRSVGGFVGWVLVVALGFLGVACCAFIVHLWLLVIVFGWGLAG